MKTYCVVKDNFFTTGTREEVISALCSWRLDSNFCLFVKFKGYEEVKCHSYSGEWTYLEIVQDVNRFIFDKLEYYGFTIYERRDNRVFSWI